MSSIFSWLSSMSRFLQKRQTSLLFAHLFSLSTPLLHISPIHLLLLHETKLSTLRLEPYHPTLTHHISLQQSNPAILHPHSPSSLTSRLPHTKDPAVVCFQQAGAFEIDAPTKENLQAIARVPAVTKRRACQRDQVAMLVRDRETSTSILPPRHRSGSITNGKAKTTRTAATATRQDSNTRQQQQQDKHCKTTNEAT
jgi:hypothetical protein